MADHSKPLITSTYVNFVSELNARCNDLALMLDPANTTATNVPNNAIRWSSAANKFQKWNSGSSTWGDLSATYVLATGTFSSTGLTVSGTAGITGDVSVGNSGVDATRFLDIIGGGTGKNYGLTLSSTKALWRNTASSTTYVGWSTSATAIAIDASGNVTVPGALSSAGSITITNVAGADFVSSNGTQSVRMGIGAYIGGTNGVIGVGSGQALQFITDGNSRFAADLTLSATGHLALGAPPSAWSTGKALEIGAIGNSVWGFEQGSLYHTAGTNYNGVWYRTGSHAPTMFQLYRGNFYWYNGTGGTLGTTFTPLTLMSLNASGDLSNIGNLSVNTGTLATYFRASGTAYTQIGDNQTLGAGTAFVIGSTPAYLGFQTAGAERGRVSSGGNWFLRTTLGSAGLNVAADCNGTADSNSCIHVFSSSDAITANNGGRITFGESSGAAYGEIAFLRDGNNTFKINNRLSGPLILGTNNTTRAQIDSNGQMRTTNGAGTVALAYDARAWVNFNGTGTVAIRASGNVTSITDHAVGDYSINFTTAMPDATYASTITSSVNATTAGVCSPIGAAPSTTALRLKTYGATFIATDSEYVNAAIHR